MARKTDPEEAFRLAMAFETMTLAASLWNENREGHGAPPLGVPIYMPLGISVAFELELLFKIVLLLEGKQPKRLHELVDIFDQIERDAPAAAAWIKDSATMHLGITDADEAAARRRGEKPTTFEDALLAADTLFQTWRYAFERPHIDPGIKWVAWPIINAARGYIVVRKQPDWKKWAPNPGLLAREWPPDCGPSYRNQLLKIEGDGDLESDALPP